MKVRGNVGCPTTDLGVNLVKTGVEDRVEDVPEGSTFGEDGTIVPPETVEAEDDTVVPPPETVEAPTEDGD
jgi:hypothetical protein